MLTPFELQCSTCHVVTRSFLATALTIIPTPCCCELLLFMPKTSGNVYLAGNCVGTILDIRCSAISRPCHLFSCLCQHRMRKLSCWQSLPGYGKRGNKKLPKKKRKQRSLGSRLYKRKSSTAILCTDKHKLTFRWGQHCQAPSSSCDHYALPWVNV